MKGATIHVTVLLSVYNQAELLPAALESVLRQTHSDWDLLAIDDASTDTSLETLERYLVGDSRICVIRNSKNIGLAASLNLGWRQARGDLIARMDADDICLPERLARQVGFLRDHPEIAVLGCAAELIDEKGRRLGVRSRPETHEELARKMYRETPFLHSAVMMRRGFLEAMGGYDPRLRRAQDTDLWLRASGRFRFHNLPDVLIQYRIQRPSWKAILGGTKVLWRSARREGRLWTRGWYAGRFFIGTLLGKIRPRPKS